MGRLFNKLSGAGMILVLTGALLLAFSLRDTVISFKTAKSFDDVLAGDAASGDHVAGRVPYLLDSFASMQTWTEDRSNNSRTPKKTSSRYYVLPGGRGYLGLTVHSSNFSPAKKLVDQTYGFLSGGAAPTAELELDTRVVEMDEELAEMFHQTLREEYGLSDAEIDAMGPFLMAEPRAFGTIRVFCGAGGALFLVGAVLMVRYWRKASAKSRQLREAREAQAAQAARSSYDPEIG